MNLRLYKNTVHKILKREDICTSKMYINDSSPTIIKELLQAIEDTGYLFAINNDKILLVDKRIAHPMFEIEVTPIGIDLLLEYCDTIITNSRQDYPEDNGGQFGLRLVLCNASMHYNIEIDCFNRDKDTRNNVVNLHDTPRLHLSNKTKREIYNKYAHYFEEIMAGDVHFLSPNEVFSFQENNISFRVDSLYRKANNEPMSIIRQVESEIVCGASLHITLNEDKFGNVIDHDGNIIQEEEN